MAAAVTREVASKRLGVDSESGLGCSCNEGGSLVTRSVYRITKVFILNFVVNNQTHAALEIDMDTN